MQARRLAWNTAITLAARASTLVLSFAIVPFLIHSVGMELYGVLGITWMVLGHLEWIDLGFSAACVHFVSSSLAGGDAEEAGRWAVTSFAAQLLMGLVGAAAIWAAAPFIVGALDVAPGRVAITTLTLRLFALVIPMELATRVLTGVLAATQRFGLISSMTLFTALLTHSVYVLGILRGGDFQLIVFGLVATRVATTAVAWFAARGALPTFRIRTVLRTDILPRARRMLGFGGWVTVNSALAPVLLYFDRWLIATALGAAAIPFFTVPFNLVTQLMLVPVALSATLFPAFSALSAASATDGAWDRARNFYVRSHKYMLATLVPAVFVLFVWAPHLLRWWVGPEFEANATVVLRLLVAGMSIGLLAPVSGALLQGAGRPDLLSRIYLAELPFNVAMMWFMVHRWGVAGAAAGFAIRTIVETMVIWVVIHRSFRWPWRAGLGTLVAPTAAAFGVLGAVAALLWAGGAQIPLLAAATLLSLLPFLAWINLRLLDGDDRTFLRGMLRRGKG